MFSYWERESFTHYNHIVIGAGIVGLSTAIELKEKFPTHTVLVLERGFLPTGASTRNAGFACMGSATELLDDLKTMLVDEVVGLFECRKKGLELLRDRLGDDNINYREQGSYELINADELPALEQITYLNDLLLPITAKPAFKIANDKIEPFGFAPGYIQALIENTCEGELHSGKMMRALTGYTFMKGIEIKTGAEVVSFLEDENSVCLKVKDPFRKETTQLKCDTLAICTNAFTRQLLPSVAVTPGRGQVLITHPIPGLKFKGIFHFDKGYYYFRQIDGRVLFGGGRNLDFEGEATTDFALSELIQADLEHKLRAIILPATPFSIDMRWTGIMALGPTRQPIVQVFSKRVSGAFRMGGMGVALGSYVARQLVDMVVL